MGGNAKLSTNTMPSQKDLLGEIETHAATLREAVAAAGVYYDQYLEEIEHTLQEQLAVNQAECDEAVERIQQEHDQAVETVLQELREVEEGCGLWAAAWDDPAHHRLHYALAHPLRQRL